MSVHPIPIANMAMDNIFIIDQASQQKFEEIAIRCLVRKLDWRLIPFMLLIEVVSYINRISTGRERWLESSSINNTLLGHTKLMEIESDLNLSQSESNWDISLFFLAYVRKLRYWTPILLIGCFCFSWSLQSLAIFSCAILVRVVICHWVCLHGVVSLSVWLS